MTKRSIFLFYEENDDKRVITNSMVRLYMNRFTIDEKNEVEIIGIQNLTKPIYPSNNMSNTAECHEWRTFEIDKLNQDVRIFEKALLETRKFVNPNEDIHFIVGSTFYMKRFTHYRMQFFMKTSIECFFGYELKIFDKLICFLVHRFSQLNFENKISCSFLCGASIILRIVFENVFFKSQLKLGQTRS